MNAGRNRRRAWLVALVPSVLVLGVLVLVADGGQAAPEQGATVVAKTDSPDPARVGNVLTYAITVSGVADRDQPFTVTDRLDKRLRFYRGSVTRAGKVGGCKATGSTVSCDLRVLIGGKETASILVVPDGVGRVRNNARAVAYDCDVDLGCPRSANSPRMSTLVVSPIELSVDAPSLTPVREDLRYRLTLTNCAGCAPIVRAVITDELPAGVKLKSATASPGSCSPADRKIVCSVGNVSGGGEATADIVVVPLAEAQIENSASATGAVKSVRGAIPVSDQASATTSAAGTDLALTMVGTPASVTVGQKVTYTLTVRNQGRVPASNVTVVDTLPSGVTVESVEPRQQCSPRGRRITCRLGSVVNSQSASITVVVTPTVVRPLRNKASVSTSTLDTDPSNDPAQAVTRVEAAADLSVVGQAGPNPVEVGKQLTYSLDVRNDGPSDAAAVTLTSRLSQGGVSSASATQGTCSRQSRTATCRLGTIASGATTTVTIVATPQSSGPIDNNVSVTARTADTSPANNSREIRAKVRSAAQPPSLSIADVDVDEDQDAVFRVTLSKPATTEVAVGYETADGTAEESSGDYEGVGSRLVFAPGETEREIAVTVGDDSRREDTESFLVRLFRPEGATIARGEGRARIRDNDAQRPSVSIRDVKVDEGETAIFAVSLSGPSATQVRVAFKTIDGTARAANRDYTPISDSLIFAPDETQKSIAITVRDDQRAEPDETFRVRLSVAAGAPVELGDPEARATIVNDDAAPPSISIGDVEVEEGEPAIFDVSLSAPAPNPVRVAYATVDGSAKASSGDYRQARSTIVFPAGETQQEIALRTVDDKLTEQDETFGVLLRNPVGATLEDRRGRALIDDDDEVVSRLVINDVQSKGGDPVVFFVTLSAPSSEFVRVNYKTVDGTATAADGDFEPASGGLEFPPGTTEQSVSVTVASPEAGEGDETFGLQLLNPVGAALDDAQGEALIPGPAAGFPWAWLVVGLAAAALVGAGALALWRWLTHRGAPVVVAPIVLPFTPRYLNLAVADDDRNLVDASTTLAAGREYLVRIDIGELDVASLVENPAKAEPGEPEKPRAGGHWLEVVLASTDVDVTQSIHRFFLPDVGRSWVCDCVGPEHTCAEDERERYLYIPIATREPTPDAVVRCTVYRENNALQAASLHLVVADGAAKRDAQHAIVDYALSRHFTQVGTLSPRLLNILTNESADSTHRIVVKDDSRAIRVDLTDAAVGQTLEAVRARFKTLSLGPDGDEPQFDEDNAKPASEFVADLKRLASLGSIFWSAVVPVRDDRLYLRERLRRRATIQVSRVSNVVFPWAVVYDIPHESQADWRLCPLLARWDDARSELESYPETCPHESDHDLNILCPYGFWGFRHVIEQPPSVRLGVLKTMIQPAEDPQAVLARSLELDEELSRRHLGELRGRFDGTFRIAECESRDAVREALADPALPLLYFYCHGKWGVFEDSSLRVPFLEIGHTDRIAPSDLLVWDDADGWDERHWGEVSPLVFINGCHTVELTPEGIVSWVEAFAGIDAAGVIGTEIAVSQAVASEVAERFYEHFIGAPNQTVGTALYQVRIDLLRKGNVTGLVYTPFCSMDLALVRAAI